MDAESLRHRLGDLCGEGVRVAVNIQGRLYPIASTSDRDGVFVLHLAIDAIDTEGERMFDAAIEAANRMAAEGRNVNDVVVHPTSELGRAIASGGPLPPNIRQVGPGRYEVVFDEDSEPA